MSIPSNSMAPRWSPEPASVSPLMQDARVGSATAVMLTLIFLALLAVPFGLRVTYRPGPHIAAEIGTDLRRDGLKKTLNRIETHLVFDSAFSKMVRPPYQALLLRAFQQGSDRVLVGKDGFLFFNYDYSFSIRPGVLAADMPEGVELPDETRADAFEEFLKRAARRLLGRRNGPPPLSAARPLFDPITSMVDFRDKLRAKGIHLVIVIVPAKAAIYPEKLWPSYSREAGPALPDGYAEWKRRLDGHGLDVIDLTVSFWEARNNSAEILFLKQDTHWSPRGVDLAADLIAPRVRRYLGDYVPAAFERHPMPLKGIHDLTTMFDLTPRQAGLPDETCIAMQIRRNGAPIPRAGNEAPVLLFGDSMSIYYDRDDEATKGLRAGLAAQLTQRLGTEIQSFSRVGDAGMLIDEVLAKQPSVLTRKKVVVWELVARGLINKYPLIDVP